MQWNKIRKTTTHRSMIIGMQTAQHCRERERFICFFFFFFFFSFLRFFLFYFIEARWREEHNYSRSCVKYTIPLTTKKKRKEQPRRRPKFPSLSLSRRNTTALCINGKEPTPFFFSVFLHNWYLRACTLHSLPFSHSFFSSSAFFLIGKIMSKC